MVLLLFKSRRKCRLPKLPSPSFNVFPLMFMSSLAVRFGRIPKREKQRLLDEMQSYMNSLNESAAMDMDSSVMDSTTSTDDCSSKEAIGTISKAYRDIFTGNNSHERSSNRTSISTSSRSSNNNNASTFSQDGGFQPSSHPNSTQSYQSCPVSHATMYPVASNDNQPLFHKVDNNHYSYLVSTNQNHNQSNTAMGQRISSTSHNSFPSGKVAQNQPSTCPWKLAPGAKVLVSVRIEQIYN